MRPFGSEVTSASPEKGGGGEDLLSRAKQLISVRSPPVPCRQDNQQLLQSRSQGGPYLTLSSVEDIQETPQFFSLSHIPQGQEVLPDV